MSLETCYAALGGDLEGVRGRMLNDERVVKFIGIFAEDPCYGNLRAALDDGNLPEAFRAAHTLKGISRDLGFTPLCEVSSTLADVLRPDDAGVPAGPLEKVPELMDRMEDAYTATMDAIAII
ncbi:MAG: Hpt domain-containing protein [Eggerthellaceae bacterium]|jgi:chemotaxis protein histidine kinase CheA|nr:Hpt domain-containing protein [Eggerthellaceae bacterium]